MQVQTLFDQINSAYRGSDDDAPTVGTPDYDLWILTANRKQMEWARDGKNTWSSLFDIRELGTVTVGTQTFDIDDDFLIPADRVFITTTENQLLDYTIIKAQERNLFNNAVYISGRDPQELTFVDTFITGTQPIGGTVNLAAYFIPENLTNSTSTVSVDDPYWLVYATAASLAANDITYSDKTADLNAQANSLYKQMVNNNWRGTNNNPRVTPTAVKKIRGYSRYGRGNW